MEVPGLSIVPVQDPILPVREPGHLVLAAGPMIPAPGLMLHNVLAEITRIALALTMFVPARRRDARRGNVKPIPLCAAAGPEH